MDETLGVFCEGLNGVGGSEHAFSNLHMNIKKGKGLAKNGGCPYGQNKSCIPVFFYSFLQ